jgi:hypothetical protein
LKFDLEALLENNMDNFPATCSNASDEFERFLNEGRCLKIKDDIFEWWHNNKNNYPNLYNIAMRFLIIQATSANSERVFSTAGYILSCKRSRLSEVHAKMLIFLNKNL